MARQRARVPLRRSPRRRVARRPAAPWEGRLRPRSLRQCAGHLLYAVVHGVATPPEGEGGGDEEWAAAELPHIDWSECVFCGAPRSSVDHLHPMRRCGRLTGYCNERWNTVPACGTCNSSKRGRNWRLWMLDGDTPSSPAARCVPDLAARVRRLDEFDRAAQQYRATMRTSEGVQRLLARLAKKVDAFCDEVGADVESLRRLVWSPG